MQWSKNLELGVAKIDAQHKELFVQADKLLDRSQQSRIPQTLDFLKGYVVKHFSAEEALQKISLYPKAPFHHGLHVDFVNKFKKLYDQFLSAGEKLTVVMAINSMVTNWLKDHILVHDKEFADYYIKKMGLQKR
ncbi:MAG: hemerythrin family protein [Deltaproteobacteria bacterium]|jgi:hemerythrin|nr:hemerythrin family protein [Deltaproteobacteria bacterium]